MAKQPVKKSGESLKMHVKKLGFLAKTILLSLKAKRENKAKKLDLISQIESFPSGKSSENITVIQIVKFLKGVHEKWKMFSLFQIKIFKTLTKNLGILERASISFYLKLSNTISLKRSCNC